MKKKPEDQRNKGEGNRTAAAESNAAQRLVRSGKVEEKAREAEKTIEGKEREALKEAEFIGRRHAAGEDPEVKH